MTLDALKKYFHFRKRGCSRNSTRTSSFLNRDFFWAPGSLKISALRWSDFFSFVCLFDFFYFLSGFPFFPPKSSNLDNYVKICIHYRCSLKVLFFFSSFSFLFLLKKSRLSESCRSCKLERDVVHVCEWMNSKKMHWKTKKKKKKKQALWNSPSLSSSTAIIIVIILQLTAPQDGTFCV